MSFCMNMPGAKTLLNEEFAKIPSDAHEAYKQLVMKKTATDLVNVLRNNGIAVSPQEQDQLLEYVTTLVKGKHV